MLRMFLVLLPLFMLRAGSLYAETSSITESEGYACMGEDKSRKQTEQVAMDDAKRKAAEQVMTYIKTETHVKDFELEKDLLSAYTNAQVRVQQELDKGWYKDAMLGDCYKVRIRAEVIPDEKAMEKVSSASDIMDNPTAPLNVQLWTDKKDYRQGEKIKVYIKGNKPFYARLIYKDASGNTLQLLPNPYRQDNYFNGGVMYEVPSGNDRFELEVSPPFGEENIIVYASPAPLGDISLEALEGLYLVKTKDTDISEMTRGVKLKAKGKETPQADFFQGSAVLKTGK
ncbi:MAG: DUF4384 domain-containing protein [Nitrospirae bacterium]|nr:DUF4384 domain-containing protein [Nitrospirota bacterium]